MKTNIDGDEITGLERTLAENRAAGLDDDIGLIQRIARARERAGQQPHFGGQGPHRYEEGSCVYCDLPAPTCRENGQHRHRYEGSACETCERPDPRTYPKGGEKARARFGCRRWVEDYERRGEAFEAFDRVTGKCAGFPGPKAAVLKGVAYSNRWRETHPSGKCEHTTCPVIYKGGVAAFIGGAS